MSEKKRSQKGPGRHGRWTCSRMDELFEYLQGGANERICKADETSAALLTQHRTAPTCSRRRLSPNRHDTNEGRISPGEVA